MPKLKPEQIRKRQAEKNYWAGQWRCALKNMPRRRGIRSSFDWIATPMNVPDYIKLNARDEVKIINGRPYLKVWTFEEFYYGQQALLTRLMGYETRRHDGRVMPNHFRILHGMHNGHQPRAQGRRELLVQLASSYGTELAWVMMKKLGIKVERYLPPKK